MWGSVCFLFLWFYKMYFSAWSSGLFGNPVKALTVWAEPKQMQLVRSGTHNYTNYYCNCNCKWSDTQLPRNYRKINLSDNDQWLGTTQLPVTGITHLQIIDHQLYRVKGFHGFSRYFFSPKITTQTRLLLTLKPVVWSKTSKLNKNWKK